MASARRAERRAREKNLRRAQKKSVHRAHEERVRGALSEDAPAADAPSFVRGFSWVHLAYLLALPALGLPTVLREGSIGPAIVTAWLPIVVYVLLLFQGYRLNAKPSRALLVALAVPGQLGALTWLTDGDVAHFFYESAVVEVGTIVGALFVAMAVARPSGVWGAALLALLPLAWIPYATPLVRSFRDWSLLSRGLFLTSVGSAFFATTRNIVGAAMRYNATKKEQTVAFEFGSDGARDGIDDATVKPLTGKPGELRRFVFFVLALVGLGLAVALVAGGDTALE